MISFTYDIPKRKAIVKSDKNDVGDNTKQILLTVSICATALIGFSLYIEYQKFLVENR